MLNKLERKLQWLAIPNLAVLLITLQALGFLMVASDSVWIERLALLPERVFAGEYWRLITFLSLPVTLSPIWLIFALWFLYFIMNSLEESWGAFRATAYVLVSILLTAAVSLGLRYPVLEASDFQSSLFLAAATLFPEMEVRLFMLVPVKMKWLAWLALFFIVTRFIQVSWQGKVLILAIYSNYLLFFGPALYQQLKQRVRRERYKRQLK